MTPDLSFVPALLDRLDAADQTATAAPWNRPALSWRGSTAWHREIIQKQWPRLYAALSDIVAAVER